MKRRRRPGVSSERAQAAVELFTDHEKLRKREIRWSLFFVVGEHVRFSVPEMLRRFSRLGFRTYGRSWMTYTSDLAEVSKQICSTIGRIKAINS